MHERTFFSYLYQKISTGTCGGTYQFSIERKYYCTKWDCFFWIYGNIFILSKSCSMSNLSCVKETALVTAPIFQGEIDFKTIQKALRSIVQTTELVHRSAMLLIRVRLIAWTNFHSFQWFYFFLAMQKFMQIKKQLNLIDYRWKAKAVVDLFLQLLWWLHFVSNKQRRLLSVPNW